MTLNSEPLGLPLRIGVSFFRVAQKPALTHVIPAPSAPLPTARQLEVLALLAQGLPNKRIASTLGIAERTVKLHVTALLRAFEADNRTHLLVLLRTRGVL
jgi:DNA-binding NarL/FixJ family response regulator